MRKTFVATLVLFLLAAQTAFCGNVKPESILGKWKTPEGDVIEFYKYQGMYYGKINYLKDGFDSNGKPIKDFLNPEKSLRNRPMVGIDLVIGLQFDGDDTWGKGRIYLPTECLVLECKVEHVDANRIKLVIPTGMFSSESEIWYRKK